MKNKILSYILLPVMILFCLQHAFAFGKTIDYRLQTADCRLQTAGYRLHENYLSLKTQNSTLKITQNPFGYSGYYHDVESGNYYLNVRYYSPALKRFTSQDTYDLTNRYRYCNGNPFDNIDPNGHMPGWINSVSHALSWKPLDFGIAALGIIGGSAAIFVSGGTAAAITGAVLGDISAASQIDQDLTHGTMSEYAGDISFASALLAAPFDIYCGISEIKSATKARPTINNVISDEMRDTEVENLINKYINIFKEYRKCPHNFESLAVDYPRTSWTIEEFPEIAELTDRDKISICQNTDHKVTGNVFFFIHALGEYISFDVDGLRFKNPVTVDRFSKIMNIFDLIEAQRYVKEDCTTAWKLINKAEETHPCHHYINQFIEKFEELGYGEGMPDIERI